MQNMKKKACDSNNSDEGGSGDLKQKERHIVTWSKEEDDILREQIGIHGTDNWAIIASKFEDKTTRQCRRRWFTYLNSDFKKGGWSQEEDMLLCEAQKIFGNRWTEIAKVVSGRTDNAVKNRFSVLCKKRAKNEASTKENKANNKRMIFDNRQNKDGIVETSVHPMKTRRKHIAAITEGDIRTTDQQLRPPFAVLLQKCHNTHSKMTPINASSGDMVEGTFLKKNDPKIVALIQQAELLNSLALEVNTEKTDQSFKNAWKVVQDFLKHSKESDVLGFYISNMEFQLENFKNLVDDITSCHEGNQLKTKMAQDDSCEIDDILPCCKELNDDVGGVCPLPNSEFNSQVQGTPMFRSMAEGIPSPQFSESERHFLLKTLGMESTTPNPTTRTSESPLCKRTLLNCL